MTEVTQELAVKVGVALTLLVEAANMVSIEELDALEHEGNMKHAIDPILDPTRYQQEGPAIFQSQRVLRAFSTFKRDVMGIGHFR